MANEKLSANNLAEYRRGMAEVEFPVSDEDFVVLLRIYYWHIEEAGFQDIYDKCAAAFKVLEKYKGLVEEYDFSLIMRFIISYANDGKLSGNTFSIGYSVDQITKTIEKNPLATEDMAIIAAFRETLTSIDEACQECYEILRSIGADHLAIIDQLLPTLASAYQDYILHALDGSGSKEVINFYERFIAATEDDNLKESAKEYLRNAKG